MIAWGKLLAGLAGIAVSGAFPGTVSQNGLAVPGETAPVETAVVFPAAVGHAPLPRIRVQTLTSAGLQAAIDAAPASGGYIICPKGTYRWSSAVTVANKANLTIDGAGTANWVLNTGAYPLLVVTGNSPRFRLTGVQLSSVYRSKTVLPFALIHTFEALAGNGLEIDHCRFSIPYANQNALTFTPYSPRNEQGTGAGNVLRGVYIHHNTATNIGRIFCEVNLHVHADNRRDVFLDDFTFSHNTLQNLGVVDGQHGMGLSIAGPTGRVTVADNQITDARFCGLEFVGTRTVRADNNRFFTTSSPYSAYSVSAAGSLRAAGLRITGGGGTVRGRPFTLYDCDDFVVTGGVWTSNQYTEIRRASGLFSGVKLTVIEGGGGTLPGGNVLQLNQSERVTVRGCTLELNCPPKVAYSVISLGARASNTQCVITGNTLKRPAGANDSFVHRDETDPNTVTNNVEIN